MTDREMLELAAKAAGVDLKYDTFGQSEDAERVYCYWNPLVDDGEAMHLAVSLKIGISFGIHGKLIYAAPLETAPWRESASSTSVNDLLAATRRAITRAAAEIGKAMQETTS